jgi:diphthamide biosynthesis protein 2
MARRTYVGLEPGPRRDEAGADADAPLEAAKGLSGRARGYAGEK